ncbi:MAG: hypothetical protein QOF76_5283 [Solirubrobacteraceae bacterium]|jgi:hypothetical protein|nr:hypothetical protein [Solirubrobacteraceae bacterium]
MKPIISRLIAATIVVVAVTAPTAQAATKTDRKQNAALKQLAKAGDFAVLQAKVAAGGADAASALAQAAQAAVAGVSAKVDAILAAVPTITKSLKDLADGLTTAGAGLTKLGSAAAAQEYGVIKLQLGGVDLPGAILVSPDIPDDSNGTTVTGTLIGSIPATTPAKPITVRAGIRSGESDGTGAALPAGQAGIVSMRIDSPNAALEGGGNAASPPAAGFYLPLTSAANATYGGAPVYDIPDKAPRVDATPNPLTIPTEKTIDLTAAATLNNFGGGVGPFTMANPTAGSIPFTVTITVRFHDLQASATDVTA